MVRRHWEDKRWRNIRKLLLIERPVCEYCNRAKSKHIHHVIPPRVGGEALAIDNLRALCQECHALETLRERTLYPRR